MHIYLRKSVPLLPNTSEILRKLDNILEQCVMQAYKHSGQRLPGSPPSPGRQPLPRQAEEQRGADVDVAAEAAPSDVHGFFAERALERLE